MLLPPSPSALPSSVSSRARFLLFAAAAAAGGRVERVLRAVVVGAVGFARGGIVKLRFGWCGDAR